MLEEILRLDTETFIYLNNLGDSSLDSFWTFLSRKEANIVKLQEEMSKKEESRWKGR